MKKCQINESNPFRVVRKFSKSYHIVTRVVGYKFLDCFGIDIWNISTGSCQCYLPFGQYGQLLQMEVKWVISRRRRLSEISLRIKLKSNTYGMSLCDASDR